MQTRNHHRVAYHETRSAGQSYTPLCNSYPTVFRLHHCFGRLENLVKNNQIWWKTTKSAWSVFNRGNMSVLPYPALRWWGASKLPQRKLDCHGVGNRWRWWWPWRPLKAPHLIILLSLQRKHFWYRLSGFLLFCTAVASRSSRSLSHQRLWDKHTPIVADTKVAIFLPVF